MQRRFYTLDVFTDTPLAGNPLAVVLDSTGLDTPRMQAIAREFNLSETVFVLEPHDPINSARIRIFTPGRELSFAGHPTVGTAVLLAELQAPGLLLKQDIALVIEEEVGAVQCIARRVRGKTRASFTLPRLPEAVGETPPVEVLAKALSLATTDIGYGGHAPVQMSAGVPFCFVPVRSPAAVDRARPDLGAWPAGLAAFIYARDPGEAGLGFHTRMFAPGFGIFEDPGTGSAAAAFAGVLMHFENLGDGDHTVMIRQGVAMGRPSLITLGLDVADGALTAASIGGHAVVIAEGSIDL